MENQNKNGNPVQHKKSHHAKPKGYFIDPPKADQQTAATPQATGNTPSLENRKHHHKRHNRHKPKNDGTVVKAVDEAKLQQTDNNPVAKENEGNAEQRSNKSGNRRNRHRNKGQSPTQQKELQITEQTKVIEPTVKETRKVYDKPITRDAPKNDFDASEYEEVRFPAVSSDSDVTTTQTAQDEDTALVEVVGIRFKSSGKVYYFAPKGKALKRGEYAIVETARGQEFGEVALGNKKVKESETVSPLRPVIRIATEADNKHNAENKEKENEAFRICNEKIIAHKLDMKLIDAQYTFDNSKLLFYFTSSGRVDFRELVKDLASVFKTRIELRQIGIRDEAKLMGGMGMCGRSLCCTLFLSDFGQVSIKMAKEQNLSLNSAKISGICGRLMCCLRYEHETYEYEIKRTPPVDSLVHTADGNGTVTEISPLAGTVKVRLASSPDTPPKTYKREDVVMLQKKHNKEQQEPKEEN